MKFQKQVLCEMDHCYATAAFAVKGRPHYLFAAENDNPCYAYDAETLERSTVWEHPGGTMSMIPLPGTDGEFLAVQGFRSGFMAQDTTIVWARPERGGWNVKTILKHPFIHRFDLLTAGDVNYFLACTLATTKANKEDWSDPGKLWAGVLPNDLNEPIRLEIIQEGLLKNHGYFRVNWEGRMAGMSASEAGVLVSTPPQAPGECWTVEKIIDRPVSEIAVIDIDGDGEDEIAAIEPFHGNSFTLNKRIDGRWREVYRYGGDFAFGHVAWGGLLRGVPAFIGGARRGDKELFLITWNKTAGAFETVVIDRGGGPSNIVVANGPKRDVIIAANREQAEAVLYHVTD